MSTQGSNGPQSRDLRRPHLHRHHLLRLLPSSPSVSHWPSPGSLSWWPWPWSWAVSYASRERWTTSITSTWPRYIILVFSATSFSYLDLNGRFQSLLLSMTLLHLQLMPRNLIRQRLFPSLVASARLGHSPRPRPLLDATHMLHSLARCLYCVDSLLGAASVTSSQSPPDHIATFPAGSPSSSWSVPPLSLCDHSSGFYVSGLGSRIYLALR